LVALLRQVDTEGRDVVLACSALRAAYRTRLAQAAKDVRFVLLHAPAEVIAERLARRRGHYMHPDLLHSQLQALETPPQAVHVDVSGTPAEAAADAKRLLKL
ncbi:MAG: AAA family ATPase, partial [Dehalococcoidia bacterium]